MKITPVVKNLLIINVIVYVAFKMILPQFESMIALYLPLSDQFAPYQFVSHMFMHADTMHLFFNLFALYMFGTAVESVWGMKKFLIYYLICGFGAALLHLAVKYYTFQSISAGIDPSVVQTILSDGANAKLASNLITEEVRDLFSAIHRPAVGASGAIFGVLLAYGMMYPNHKIMLIFLPIPIAAKYFIPLMMAAELYLGVNQFDWDNVAHFAHLGGALVGFLLIMFWKKFPMNLT